MTLRISRRRRRLEMDYEREPDRLVGQYFTDRRTTGDIDIRRVSRDISVVALPSAVGE